MIRLLLNVVLFLLAISNPSRADWSGLYVGAHAGGVWGEADGRVQGLGLFSPYSTEDSLDLDGVVGGVHGGYAWQFGQLVIGVEGDYTVTDAEGDWRSTFFGVKQTVTNEVDYLASVRGRLGYDCGSYLLYGTAGVAWTQYELADEISVLGASLRIADKENLTGWVWGGGMAAHISSKLSARLDVLRYEFDDVELKWGNVLEVNGSIELITVRAGLDLRLEKLLD